MEDLFGAAVLGLFFKETRGYILGFFVFVTLLLLVIFFPWIVVVALVVAVVWTIIFVVNSESKESLPLAARDKINISKNKISSVSTKNSISVYTSIDNATNTVNVTIEDPETKKKTKPIIFEIKNIVSDAGIVKEYFQDENIEIVQSKNKSGYEFEVNVKNSNKLYWE